MEEISKKELLQQINEAEYGKKNAGSGLYIPRDKYAAWEKESHPDAREARGEPREYPKRPSDAAESPDWFDRRAARAYQAREGGAPVSDMMIIDDPENEGGLLVVVQREGNTITLITEQTLKDENPDFHTWATTPPNRLAFIDVKRKIGKDWFGGRRNPLDPAHIKRREMVSAIPFPGEKYNPKDSDEKATYTESEKILRELNGYIREFATITKEQLNAAGLPEIVAPFHEYRRQKENINKYTTISNNTIVWSTQNVFGYPIEQYIQNAKSMYRGQTPEFVPEAQHAVRQNNPGRNWSITRPSEIKPQSYKDNPLTPIYQNRKEGYDPNDIDAMVADVFTFTGLATEDNGFTWRMEFKTKYGDKLKEETRIKGGLVWNEAKDIYFTSTASTGPLEELLGPNGSIASNPAIMDAFKEALIDMTSKIESIDARQELRRRFAGVGKTDITRQVNESLDIDSIVSKIMNEIKQ
jgi:hypothetical protein